MYSLFHAQAELEEIVESRRTLQIAIARGDLEALDDIIPLAHHIVEKVDIRFLVAWAEDEEMLNNFDDLVVNASQRLCNLVLLKYGWRTGQTRF